MGETAKTSKPVKEKKKRSIFQNLKGEFKKIIWPNKTQLQKETVAVVVIAAVLCFVIAILDTVLATGIGFLVG